MGKREKQIWERFGDIAATGNSVPEGWFGRRLLAKWMRAGLVRTVRHWEDGAEVRGKTLAFWNTGEIVPTEKALELL